MSQRFYWNFLPTEVNQRWDDIRSELLLGDDAGMTGQHQKKMNQSRAWFFIDNVKLAKLRFRFCYLVAIFRTIFMSLICLFMVRGDLKYLTEFIEQNSQSRSTKFLRNENQEPAVTIMNKLENELFSNDKNAFDDLDQGLSASVTISNFKTTANSHPNQILNFQIESSYGIYKVKYLIIMQVLSGFISFYFSYISSSTRIQRFSLAIPIWLTQLLALIKLITVCQNENSKSLNNFYYCHNYRKLPLPNWFYDFAQVFTAWHNCEAGDNNESGCKFSLVNILNSTSEEAGRNSGAARASDNDNLSFLNDKIFIIIAVCYIILTILSIYSATIHAWNEHPQLLLSSHMFTFNVYSTSNGMMENCILTNLKTNPKDTYQYVSYDNFERHDFERMDFSQNSYSSISSDDSVMRRFKKHAYKNTGKALLNLKVPFIYACPTLFDAMGEIGNCDRDEDHSKRQKHYHDYDFKKFSSRLFPSYRETDYEMKQLFTSILRLNKDQLKIQILRSFNNENPDPKYHLKIPNEYDIEFNCFFDRCFDVSSKISDHEIILNEWSVQLHTIIRETAGYVRMNDLVTFYFEMSDKIKHMKGLPVYLKDVPREPVPKIDLPIVTETPYGLQLLYLLPIPQHPELKKRLKKVIFRVHLKDHRKINAGKRWSQCLYLYWLNVHKRKIYQRDHPEDFKNKEFFILALDGDVDFKPAAMTTLLTRMRRTQKVGACCGRIFPMGYGPLYWFQIWEYSVGHWLQKATEDILGSVLCSPGCFSLIRADACLEDINCVPNSLIRNYISRPTDALNYIQWNMGEDRWMCTLLLQRGWRIEYVAVSDSFTYAPTELGEFFKQRRRWGPSTIFNIFDLIKTGDSVRKINDSISQPYLIYHLLLQVSAFLGPSTVAMIIQGSLVFVFKWDNIIALVVSLIPLIFFTYLCFYHDDDTQLMCVNIMCIMYSLVMLVVLIAISVSLMDNNAMCSVSSQFILFIYLSQIFAGLLHIREAHPLKATIYTLFIYSLMMPTAFILLNLYQFCNLHVTSWGTREAKQAAESKNKKKSGTDGTGRLGLNGEIVDRKYASRTMNWGNLLYCHCCPDESDFRAYNELVVKETIEKIEEEKIKIIDENKDLLEKLKNQKYACKEEKTRSRGESFETKTSKKSKNKTFKMGNADRNYQPSSIDTQKTNCEILPLPFSHAASCAESADPNASKIFLPSSFINSAFTFPSEYSSGANTNLTSISYDSPENCELTPSTPSLGSELSNVYVNQLPSSFDGNLSPGSMYLTESVFCTPTYQELPESNCMTNSINSTLGLLPLSTNANGIWNESSAYQETLPYSNLSSNNSTAWPNVSLPQSSYNLSTNPFLIDLAMSGANENSDNLLTTLPPSTLNAESCHLPRSAYTPILSQPLTDYTEKIKVKNHCEDASEGPTLEAREETDHELDSETEKHIPDPAETDPYEPEYEWYNLYHIFESEDQEMQEDILDEEEYNFFHWLVSKPLRVHPAPGVFLRFLYVHPLAQKNTSGIEWLHS